jgi:hypothetical protein
VATRSQAFALAGHESDHLGERRRCMVHAGDSAEAASSVTAWTPAATGTGRTPLKKNTSGLSIAASENFRPYVHAPSSVTMKFAL